MIWHPDRRRVNVYAGARRRRPRSHSRRTDTRSRCRRALCVDGRERIRKCGRFACANRSLADQGAGEPSRTRELPQTNGDRGEPRRVPSPTGPYPAGVTRFRRFRSEAIAARRRSVRSDRGEDDDSRPRVSLPGKSSRSRISPRARRSRSVGRPSRLSPVGGTRRYPAASARYLALDIESADIDCAIESVSDRCLPPGFRHW